MRGFLHENTGRLCGFKRPAGVRVQFFDELYFLNVLHKTPPKKPKNGKNLS